MMTKDKRNASFRRTPNGVQCRDLGIPQGAGGFGLGVDDPFDRGQHVLADAIVDRIHRPRTVRKPCGPRAWAMRFPSKHHWGNAMSATEETL
jgi:hypothetical protein